MAYGTKWYRKPIISHDEKMPFVNIYCEGSEASPHALYLVGMLAPSVAVFEAMGTAWWTAIPSYVAGDGTLIRLDSRRASQSIETGANGDQIATYLVGDQVLHTAHDRGQADQSKIRSTYDLHCRECGLRLSLRSDDPKVHTMAATLYSVGFKEISLPSLHRRFVG
jgi:hypothetical protein